jgi:hypothetical protein
MEPDGADELCFTSIGSDNMRARRLLEHGARGMPAYTYLSELDTLLIAVPRFPRRPKLRVEAATVDRIPDMLRMLNGHACGHQLATVWTAQGLQDLERHGLPLSRFFLILEGDELLACGALWDQRGFRQTVIQRYSPLLSPARPWVNLVGSFTKTPRMPRPGRPLAHAFLSPLAFAQDVGKMLPAVVESFFPLAAEFGLEFLTIALPANDYRIPVLQQRTSTRKWRTRLYRVDWPDRPRFEITSSGMPFFPDVALL